MYRYICVNKFIIRGVRCIKQKTGLELIFPFWVEATLDVLQYSTFNPALIAFSY